MRNYDLTDEAESDLRQIIRHTLEAIGNQTLVGMTFSDNLPAIRVVKSQHHYIFYTLQNHPRALVLAFYHERQNLVVQLEKRLT